MARLCINEQHVSDKLFPIFAQLLKRLIDSRKLLQKQYFLSRLNAIQRAL